MRFFLLYVVCLNCRLLSVQCVVLLLVLESRKQGGLIQITQGFPFFKTGVFHRRYVEQLGIDSVRVTFELCCCCRSRYIWSLINAE